jgi:NAD(P)-dependent dehydrogenase (short-subunit alcohol dehydrogenase family)
LARRSHWHSRSEARLIATDLKSPHETAHTIGDIASKMGIIGFIRGLANDVAGDGITANAVLSGLMNTQATTPQSEEQKRATWEQQAIKRMEEPEDVTVAILFLTCDVATFITGQALVGDGGQYRVG